MLKILYCWGLLEQKQNDRENPDLEISQYQESLYIYLQIKFLARWAGVLSSHYLSGFSPSGSKFGIHLTGRW